MNAMTTAHTTKVAACTCPVCRGLELFESPKYSTGALLTAEDLSTEQAFVRAKMRLHNRHLHGWGTVCGLKVVCDDCEGSVRILPGYALDPCGNDLVLADSTRFDLVKAIRDCRDAKRPKLGDCDPYVPPPDPGCRDVETYWCVTLRFNELESGHSLSLAHQPLPKGGCGCDCGGQGPCRCGGNGNGARGCGCNGGGAARTASVATASPSGVLGYTLPGCTPRRLVECVEIGMVRHDGPCQPQWRSDPQSGEGYGSPFASLVPPDSLLGRIFACMQDAASVLRNRVGQNDLAVLAPVFSGAAPGSGVTPQAIRDALCRLRQALLDFLMRHDPVRCQMLRTLAELLVPEILPNETAADYAARARPVLQNLASIWLQAFVDCVCGSFLPLCADDPTDMRVPIACVTVRGDRIVAICNHSCRRYAGAFPSLFYWLSIVPIVPFFSRLLAILCCAPDAVSRNSPLVNHLWPIVDSFDPTGAWRRAFAEGGFALPRTVAAAVAGLDVEALVANRFAPPADPVSTAPVLGLKPQAAITSLSDMGVAAELEEVDDPDAPELKLATLGGAVVGRGSLVRLYVHQGKVVGVGRSSGGDGGRPATHDRTPEAPAAEIAELRQELAALKEEVARLQPKPTRGKGGPR